MYFTQAPTLLVSGLESLAMVLSVLTCFRSGSFWGTLLGLFPGLWRPRLGLGAPKWVMGLATPKWGE